MQKKTMYLVEKFLPPECPKCRAGFKEEGKDYGRLLGDLVDGKKRFRETPGYSIIVCAHCENMTMRIDQESWQVSDQAQAEALLSQGFVNLREVIAIGNMAVDHHVRHGRLEFVKGDEIEDADEPRIQTHPSMDE
jgi:hypothetical protein